MGVGANENLGWGLNSSDTDLIYTHLDCQSDIGNNVQVQASSYMFNSSGRYTCSYGENVIYPNGNIIESIKTTCLFSAKWENEDIVNCSTSKF